MMTRSMTSYHVTKPQWVKYNEVQVLNQVQLTPKACYMLEIRLKWNYSEGDQTILEN